MTIEFKMPILQPVPIATKGQPLLQRLWALLTVTRQWKLTRDWYYRLPNERIIIIPAGFVFDGASIPKPLWGFLSPVGLLLIGGLIHDFAYRYGYLWEVVPDGGDFSEYYHGQGSRHDWDELFLEVNLEVNGMLLTDYVATFLLKLFGDIAWQANREANAPEMRPKMYGEI